MEDPLDLITLAKNGDKEAFGKLYKEYYERIYRYCSINIYKSGLAQDICQETFIRAWKSLPSFTLKDGGTFQAYLFRIARNLIIDLSRKKRAFSLAEYEEIETHDDFEERIDKENDIEKVKFALSKLDEKERQIVILRYFEDMSHKEVASIVGLNEGAIRVKTTRLLKKMKDILIKT